MSIYSGSFSVTQFSIVGPKAKRSIAKLNELVEPYKIKRLRFDGVSDQVTFGWSAPLNRQEVNSSKMSEWDVAECEVNNGFLLRMQLEKRRVPSSLMQLYYKQELLDMELRRKTPIKRNERVELKQKLKDELQQRVLPQISFVDGYWSDETSKLYIFSNASNSVELYRTLFELTFAKELKFTLQPWSVDQLEFDSEKDLNLMMQAVANVQPTIFAPQQVQ